MSDLRLFTSESVTEGHPDKICDQISDSILDALLAEDPQSRVAVETLVTTGLVHVAGEVTTEAYVEIPPIVRKRITEIGYDSSDVWFDGRSCGVEISIGGQSPDIAQGVDDAFETRERVQPRRVRPAGRRRPGHHVRLRHPRDPRADADPDLDRPPARRAARRRAQVRRTRLPPSRRQDPGHDRLRRHHPAHGRDRRALHPALPGGVHRPAARRGRGAGDPARAGPGRTRLLRPHAS